MENMKYEEILLRLKNFTSQLILAHSSGDIDRLHEICVDFTDGSNQKVDEGLMNYVEEINKSMGDKATVEADRAMARKILSQHETEEKKDN